METSCNDVLPSQERRSVFTGVGRKSRKIGPKKESEDDKDKEREYDTSDMSTDDSDVEPMDEEKTTDTLPALPIPTDDKTESIPVKPVDVKADVRSDVKVDVKPVENKITVIPRKPAVNIVVERKEKIEVRSIGHTYFQLLFIVYLETSTASDPTNQQFPTIPDATFYKPPYKNFFIQIKFVF